jgi:hypothetical protein
MKHHAMITAESSDDGDHITITITCDTCGIAAPVAIASTHLETLTRGLQEICAAAGIDLTKGPDPLVFNLNDPTAKTRAAEAYAALMQRRNDLKD